MADDVEAAAVLRRFETTLPTLFGGGISINSDESVTLTALRVDRRGVNFAKLGERTNWPGSSLPMVLFNCFFNFDAVDGDTGLLCFFARGSLRGLARVPLGFSTAAREKNYMTHNLYEGRKYYEFIIFIVYNVRILTFFRTRHYDMQ